MSQYKTFFNHSSSTYEYKSVFVKANSFFYPKTEQEEKDAIAFALTNLGKNFFKEYGEGKTPVIQGADFYQKELNTLTTENIELKAENANLKKQIANFSTEKMNYETEIAKLKSAISTKKLEEKEEEVKTKKA